METVTTISLVLKAERKRLSGRFYFIYSYK